MLKYLYSCLLCILSWPILGQNDTIQLENIEIQDFELSYYEFEKQAYLKFTALDEAGNVDFNSYGKHTMFINDDAHELIFYKGLAQLPIEEEIRGLKLVKNSSMQPSFQLIQFNTAKQSLQKVSMWLSIIPPILAILLALLLKEVMVSLFAGIWIGAAMYKGLSLESLASGLFDVVETYLIHAITDSGHASIVVFSIVIGGMVSVISKNGGMTGVVNHLSRFAKSARSSQLITWFLGVAIFFDDYANTLIVGNTMRPVTDKFKVSREKLAYIVDSTAAPVAAVAFITTWIGAELGYIEDAISGYVLDQSAYGVFINSLKYAYYPVFTLFFILVLVWSKKEYGPMLQAEQAARMRNSYPGDGSADAQAESANEELTAKEGIRHQWWYAVLPILILVFTVIMRLWYTGVGSAEIDPELGFFKQLQAIIGSADSYSALLWGSFAGLGSALLLSIAGKKLSMMECADAVLMGFKTMMPAVVILVLAWGLAHVTEQLHTSAFLISIVPEGLSPLWFPMIFFILSACVAFATGSSWGCMAILYPLCLPVAITQTFGMGMDPALSYAVLFNVTSVVLAGSVLGDHCSPISDTTILSSLASSCKHIEHVRTQLPYALTVGSVAILCGGVLFAFGVPWYMCYLIGAVLLVLVIKFFGKELGKA